jgi:hypothetical protein
MEQIYFTKEEKRLYPLIERIREGLTVIGIDHDNKGLLGIVTEVLYEKKRKNDTRNILDVIVDFYTPFEDTIEKSYPLLNGISLVQVIKSESELAFFFEEGALPVTADGIAYDLRGDAVDSGQLPLIEEKKVCVYVLSKGTGSEPSAPQIFKNYAGKDGVYHFMKSQYQNALSKADGNLDGVISTIEANITETQAHINCPDQIDCEDNMWWFITECIIR